MDLNGLITTAIAAVPVSHGAVYSVVPLYHHDPRGAFFWSADRYPLADVEPRTGFAADFPAAVAAAHAAATAVQGAGAAGAPIYVHNDFAARALHNLDALGPVRDLLASGEKPPLWWSVKYSAGAEDPLVAAWRASDDPEAVLAFGCVGRQDTMDEAEYAAFLCNVLRTVLRFGYQLTIGGNGMRLDGGPRLPHDGAFAAALREVLFAPPRLAAVLQLGEILRRVGPGACCACGTAHTAYDYAMTLGSDAITRLRRAVLCADGADVEAIVRDLTERLHAPPACAPPSDPCAGNGCFSAA